MLKLPVNNKWSQLNSDRFGSLAYTKNINLDEEGYIKLSPRTVNIFDGSANTANIADTDFFIPSAFGRNTLGDFYIVTTDEPFNLTYNTTTKTIAEDTLTDNPDLTAVSHGVWWQNRFYESTDTTVIYKSPGDGSWNSAITGLTSGKRHYMAVRASSTLLVTNGNVIKQYATDHSGTGMVDLTIPSDFEAVGVAYNAGKIGIITRLGDSYGAPNQSSKFYIWDGTTTSANGYDIGSYSGVAIVPYKSSFVVLTSTGQLLYWNGGGFQELAHFPFYDIATVWGDLTNILTYGNGMISDGDVIYINVNFDLSGTGKKLEEYPANNPSGVWCYDPRVGLYHRWSPSISPAYLHTITSGNIDTDTNIFTTSATIPATGNPVMLTGGSVGGLKLSEVYYVIKIDATTFKLATSKENADVGVAINITSAGATESFYMYDVIDYGATVSTSRSGAIENWGAYNRVLQDVIFGGNYNLTTLATVVGVLCTAVPQLENRGYFVTLKTFLNDVTDTYQKLFIKFRPLYTNDKIIVKYRSKDIFGLPTCTPNGASTYFTWTGTDAGYTTADLSEVKTQFDNGVELECEFIAGTGAGQMVKITNVTESSGTYTLEFEEDVVGAASNLQSYFTISNWETLKTITTADEDFAEVTIGKTGKWAQFKIELRGYETTIEELQIINAVHKASQ